MRFTFPFETLLNMKKNLEELSQMRLAKKMSQLREQEEAIQRILDERVIQDRVLKEKSEQGMKASEYLVYKTYQEDCVRDLQLKRAARRQTKKEIEAEQKILIQLMKERKMFEKLKEKQWKKFQSQTERLDQKNSDEMVITRYRPSPNITLS
jgi:flagellar FliJ protein